MVPDNRYDVAIIGAGIVGLTSAYHIKKNNPDVNIVVIDKAPTYAQGNTARSAAGFRDMFSSDMNFNLSNSTIGFYRHVQEDLGFDMGMQFVGYLFLTSNDDPRLQVLQKVAQRSKVRTIDADSLSRYDFLKTKIDDETKSLMNLKDIDIGILGENCGTIEPELVVDFYYNSALRMGVKFLFNTHVKEFHLEPVDPMDYPGEPFLWQKKKLRKLETNNGDIEADIFIACTDVWTTGLLDNTGIDSHIRPKKRQVFQISGPNVESVLYGWDQNDDGVLPFTILPSYGVYLRPAPKAKSLWVGVADDYNRDFSFSEEPEAEKEYYENSLAQVVHAYIPTLTYPKVTGMWAGYYAYNTIDGTPYIFRDLNIIVASGTSGSGILKGDSIGRIVEAVYSGKEYAELYNVSKFKASALGIENREVEKEEFII
jgi:glycine/D-amino acid oxidase-like deaminating enzyme